MKIHWASFGNVISYGSIVAYFVWMLLDPSLEEKAVEQFATVIFSFEFFSIHSSFMLAPFMISKESWNKGRWMVYLLLGFYLLFSVAMGFLTQSIAVPLSFVISTWSKVFGATSVNLFRTIGLVVFLLLTGPVIGIYGSLVWVFVYFRCFVFLSLLQMFNVVRH